MLREFGCPEAQGFLYVQPGAPEATGTAEVTPIKRETRPLIIGFAPQGDARSRWRWCGFRRAAKKDMRAPADRRLRPRPHHAAGLRGGALGRHGGALFRRRGLCLGFCLDRGLGLWRGSWRWLGW